MKTKFIPDDEITVTALGHIQVREATIIFDDDGNEVSRSFHRYVIDPGGSLDDCVQSIVDAAVAVWTPSLLAAYAARQEEINRQSVF